jgi:hypothetical protein
MSKTYISRAGFSAVCFALILSGCATNSYTPPSSLAKDEAKHEVMVNKSFDATWASLIDYASGTFFAIDNFEKASGLITLSFGAADPSHFIDCGQMVAPIFQGSFATFMATEWNATLTGRMNLVVRQVEPNKTLVRANARYIFVFPSQAGIRGNSWTFDSGSEATVKVHTAIGGTTPTRTCRPSYAAERAILEAVSK